MRVVLYVTKTFDWVPVPPNTIITPEDVANGRLMPDRNGGYRMRVLKSFPAGTPRTITISESDVVGKMIHEKTDIRRAGRNFSRKEAVAHLIMDNALDPDLDWSWISKIEVHDDGPDEALARALLTPHTQADHGRRPGEKNIPPDQLEPLIAKYMEPADVDAHTDHLHRHFNVKKGS